MANLVKKERRGTVYTIELTEDEYNLLGGLVNDWLDNPQRQITMKYGVDETEVRPTERAHALFETMASTFNDDPGDYDYDDFWRAV